MIALLLRLFALVAVALMPAAMISAPAAAQPAQVTSASSHCAGGHEEQEQRDQAPAGAEAHCMACAGLPITDVLAAAELALPTAPRFLAHSRGIIGDEPEIVTPPPKRA